MTATYRFRLEVLDQPGLLAKVTDAVAAAGGNVERLDIHQPHNGTSIDEISIAAPEDWDMLGLGATLDAIDGVRVLHQARQRDPGDAVVNALRWARVMVAAGPEEHDLELTRAILEVTGGTTAWTANVPTAARSAAGYAALVARTPVIKRADTLPEHLEADRGPDELAPPYWLLAAGDDPDDPTLVAFAARPLATPFSVSETARLEALLRLRRALAPSRAPVPA